jgi:sulfur carrier protein
MEIGAFLLEKIMQLHVNGEAVERPDGETLTALVVALGADKGRVATMVNDDVVPATARANRRLAAGDRIEILTFAGGG